MKAMITGFAVMILIGALAWAGLDRAGFSSAEVHSGDSVRLD